MSRKEIRLGVGNYYGNTMAIKDGDTCYFELENYNGSSRRKISEKLFSALEEEYGITEIYND